MSSIAYWPFILLATACWLVKYCDEIKTWIRRTKKLNYSGPFTKRSTSDHIIDDIDKLAKSHEVAAALSSLIHNDGASSWPPAANHHVDEWPAALRGYKAIYLALAGSLPTASPSLDQNANRVTIDQFRLRFDNLLQQHVDLVDVLDVFEEAKNEALDNLSPAVRNAFYSCVAWCRHAYRWGVVPVVKAAQEETVVDLPRELVDPWNHLQRYYGCSSQSGNVMSGLILNFDDEGNHIFKANSGLSETIVSAEEQFARIFRDIEASALPIYHDMVCANVAWSAGNRQSCIHHLSRIQKQLRPLMSIYFDRMHDQKIARSAWLSHVQGFLAWGAGYRDEQTGKLVKFDGLSGNQILLFQAIDAFLGMESYLSIENLEQNVPFRQREFCRLLRKHSIRDKLADELEPHDDILQGFDQIIKRLRLFRSAHRTRSLEYLRQPAPERHPMTAGKSMLSSDLEESLTVLDGFMVNRLKETV